MKQFWYVTLMTSLTYLTTILPIGLFFSETDEEEKLVSKLGNLNYVQATRICKTMTKEFVLLVIVIIGLFPSFAFLRNAMIPVAAQTCTGGNYASTNTTSFINATTVVTAANSVRCVTSSSTLNT